MLLRLAWQQALGVRLVKGQAHLVQGHLQVRFLEGWQHVDRFFSWEG